MTRRGWLGVVALGVSACDAPDGSAVTTNELKALQIDGVTPLRLQDRVSTDLSSAASSLRLDFRAKGLPEEVAGGILAADPALSLSDIAQRVGAALGPSWRPTQAFSASVGNVDCMVWQYKQAQRLYAMLAYKDVMANNEGRRFRPMYSMFTVVK